jgi:hypothetical protein
MALNTWHVALSDPNDPDSDRTVVMSDDEVRDAYPQFAGRAAQFVDRDGVNVHITVTAVSEDVSTVRDVVIDDVNRCPNLILSFEHWIDRYACRCGEPDYPLMTERGYVWDKDLERWHRSEASALERWNARPNPELDEPWIRS